MSRLLLDRLLDLTDPDDGLVRLQHHGDGCLHCSFIRLVGLNSLSKLESPRAIDNNSKDIIWLSSRL